MDATYSQGTISLLLTMQNGLYLANFTNCGFDPICYPIRAILAFLLKHTPSIAQQAGVVLHA